MRIVRTERELPATDNPRAIMVKDDNSKTGFSPLIVRSQVCVAKEAWSQFQVILSNETPKMRQELLCSQKRQVFTF